MRHIILSPKYSGVSTKYGKFHASRDKLYIQLNSHMVPKASPLHASEIVNSYTEIGKKPSARFGEHEEKKIAFSCLLQARKRNIFTSCSPNLAESF